METFDNILPISIVIADGSKPIECSGAISSSIDLEKLVTLYGNKQDINRNRQIRGNTKSDQKSS